MALFLDVHELDGREPEMFLATWTAGVDGEIRCLKHWLGETTIGLLVEAPDAETLRAHDPEAAEVTELFASSDRWASYESIDLEGPRNDVQDLAVRYGAA